MSQLHRGILLFFLLSSSAWGQIEGKGGIVSFFGLMDFANMRGQHASLPASGAEPSGRPSYLTNNGIYLWYIGLKGYSENIYPLRPGIEAGAGFNFLSSNSFMNARAFYVGPFLQWMIRPWVGIELSTGYNFLEFPENDNLLLGHFYGFPKMIFEWDLSEFSALQAFGGFYLPVDSTLWRVYVTEAQNNSFGLSGLLGVLHVGVAFVVSEKIFSSVED